MDSTTTHICTAGGILLLALSIAPSALAGPTYPGDFTPDKKIAALKKKVGAKTVPIEGVAYLAKTKKLLADAKAKKGAVRILQLGDSHIASDYITSRIRHRLQGEYGNAGRGFVHVDQAWGYGGRRLKKKAKEWLQDRIVDKDRAGRPFGFSGMSLESKTKGAKLQYRVEKDEMTVRLFYYMQPGGSPIRISLDGHDLGSIETNGPGISQVFIMDLKKAPLPKKPAKMKGPPGGRVLELVAGGPKARIFGLSFEKDAPGVIYESIGPVGADAKVYLQLGRESLTQHLGIHRPDLIVLMVGGNDALKIRKKWTDPDRVKKDHEELVDLLRTIVPSVEILMWAPMDAGDRVKGKVVSKGFIPEIREMQRAVATDKKIAFWDTLEAMGGPGTITSWDKARVMNKDLVHPTKPAADLLGDLFADAFLAL